MGDHKKILVDKEKSFAKLLITEFISVIYPPPKVRGS
jgi:hypothetical protein